MMKRHTIEVDEIIMNYLKKKADPFVDTPNTVLHKLLFRDSKILKESSPLIYNSFKSIPKALSQILEVIEEVVKNGFSRPEATTIVANRNDTALQTIMDKYCRQLGKTAIEVDMLLSEPKLEGFRIILTKKFPNHRDLIATFFNGLNEGKKKMDQINQHENCYHRPIMESTKTQSDLKKLDAALDKIPKDYEKTEIKVKDEYIPVEVCKNSKSSNYFIFLEEQNDEKGLLILPNGESKCLELDKFHELEEQNLLELLKDGTLTKEQLFKYEEYLNNDDHIEKPINSSTNEPAYIDKFRKMLKNDNTVPTIMFEFVKSKKKVTWSEIKNHLTNQHGYSDSGSYSASLRVLFVDGYINIEGKGDTKTIFFKNKYKS
ncbi:MAG: hypothetical protein HOG03_12420 [Desulfobacula sp.]|uniref:hypothetical protein n=5 Tax=Desulfobacula sp. TaxID=2593537 RepID=UPI001DFF2A49|nr:hypothetical protein [Desulfobacula sp.]MBT3805383.1 hypothetical protein [Desulfobacula sp.]MBT4024537.1 hypothetical protein [Desulfobacula sp.]MBT4507768.1 hypothetical protein [Desulfobacula sp.]MBT5544652.1 hypothetical protein [Desulfobacula sp.]